MGNTYEHTVNKAEKHIVREKDEEEEEEGGRKETKKGNYYTQEMFIQSKEMQTKNKSNLSLQSLE